jgi:hypothetical protein
MKSLSSKQVKTKNNNPTGKGGFQDHPELRSNGRWDKKNSVSYWMRYLLKLTVAEFRKFEESIPENERTVAASLAYARVLAARSDRRAFDVVANRTEGYPKQSIDDSGASKREFSDWSEEELNNKITSSLLRDHEIGWLKMYDSQNREVKISKIEYQESLKYPRPPGPGLCSTK